MQCVCDVRTVLAHAVRCEGSREASPPWFLDVLLKWVWFSAPPMERADEVRENTQPNLTYPRAYISCRFNFPTSLVFPAPPSSPLPPLPLTLPRALLLSLQPSPLLLATVCVGQSILQVTPEAELGRLVQLVCEDLLQLDQASHLLMLKALIHQSCNVCWYMHHS